MHVRDSRDASWGERYLHMSDPDGREFVLCSTAKMNLKDQCKWLLRWRCTTQVIRGFGRRLLGSLNTCFLIGWGLAGLDFWLPGKRSVGDEDCRAQWI